MYFGEVCIMRRGLVSLFAIISLMGGIFMLTACTQERTEVTLRYPVSDARGTTAERTVVWDDSRFSDTGTFSPEIARMCAVMCSCAGDSDIAQTNFGALGFEKTAKFSYGKDYNGDKVGVLIAKRRVGTDTLVAVVIRGTQGREWYSNFDVGNGIEHRGFSLSADFVLERLQLYLVDYGIREDEAKYLITGYSRGGAVANLVAQRLSAGGRPVFGYTFASPNTTTADSTDGCRGVYNIVRDEDIFTYVPLSAWGYRRYGTDVVLSVTTSSTPDSVKAAFRDITGDEYVGFDDTAPIRGFLQTAQELAPSVEAYYNFAYPVGDSELTLYEYMNIAARFLSGEEDETDADLLMSTLGSDYAELTGFFMSGVDVEELLFSGDFSRSSVADSHAYVSYLAALDEFIESSRTDVY